MNKIGLLCCVAAIVTTMSGAEKVHLSLPNVQGAVKSLSDHRGKVVILDFWASWCAPCYKAFPMLNELQDSLREEIVVLGINLEKIEDEKLSRVIEQAKIEYTILKDPEGKTAKQFGIKGLPSIVVIDTSGSVVSLIRGVEKDTEERLQHAVDSLTRN